MRRPAPRARLLAVDVGNTETVVGLMEGREVRRMWRLSSGRPTADEVALQLRELLRDEAAVGRAAPLHPVLSSVVPALTMNWGVALARHTGRAVLEVGAATAKSLRIRYHDPTSVGADRIANAVAARGLYGTPAIVVDLGTSTNFDCISREGDYLGGALAPGVATSAEELFRRAARIPRVELRRPAHAIGRTTAEAVQSGVVWGAAGLVDALVRRLALEMKGTPHVIATGGIARLIAPECETINVVDEALTLKGLALVWEENA
ncbi:MAG: hypothetical protein A2W00_05150 [Candidatus Eisenbacteria bacterium RBG_16_71_46]|nr:MAG: hypothetical protein A2W00_05150 [Candidatus Eisenbacteria bacterium RBG_16_71_46]